MKPSEITSFLNLKKLIPLFDKISAVKKKAGTGGWYKNAPQVIHFVPSSSSATCLAGAQRERERIVSRVPVVLEMVPCMCGRFKFRKCSSDECQWLLEIFLVWFMMQILHLHRTLQNCSVFGKRRVCIIHLKKRIVSCIVEAAAARSLNIAGSVRVHVRNLGFYNRLANETRFYIFMPNHLRLVLP